MERNTIHFPSLSSGAQFALASYNSNLGPLDMKLYIVNYRCWRKSFMLTAMRAKWEDKVARKEILWWKQQDKYRSQLFCNLHNICQT